MLCVIVLYLCLVNIFSQRIMIYLRVENWKFRLQIKVFITGIRSDNNLS